MNQETLQGIATAVDLALGCELPVVKNSKSEAYFRASASPSDLVDPNKLENLAQQLAVMIRGLGLNSKRAQERYERNHQMPGVAYAATREVFALVAYPCNSQWDILPIDV